MHHRWANNFLQITLLGVFAVDLAQAQVACTMPNGKVITQQLSDKCPPGAIKGETLDGKSISVAPTRIGAPPKAARDQSRPLTAAETLGEKWPLTVTDVVMRCEAVPHPRLKLGAVTATHRGTTYAVNGIAEGRASDRGWRDINAIWKPNPEIPGTKIPIGALIEYGLQLCR